jgi:hypothetical protein
METPTPTDLLVEQMRSSQLLNLSKTEQAGIRENSGAGEDLDRHGYTQGTSRITLANGQTYLIQNPRKFAEGWIHGFTPCHFEASAIIQISQIASIQLTE